MRILNFPCELYLDARAFGRQAGTEKNQFVRWRLQRASLLAAFAALESAANLKLNIQGKDRKSTLEKWESFSLVDRSTPEDKALWATFEELTSVRHALVHYKGTNEKTESAYTVLDKGINSYLATLRELFVRLYGVGVIAAWEANPDPIDRTVGP